ncbi:MAG: TonB-dependent receptor plug domain-containing protein [Acidobacteriota bacterium]
MISLFLLCFAALHGIVEDPQGRPVDGAQVTLYRGNTVERTRTQAGRFTFANTAGRALIEVAAEGFRRVSREVEDNQTIRLEVAGVDQSIVVTAEGAAQNLDEAAKSTSLLDADGLTRRNENNLAEALRDVPGLLIRNLGGPGQLTTIRSRGLRAEATAVLIDGLRFRDVAAIQADASGFIGNLNLINLSRVEGLRGSGSSLYGTNAAGSTINLVSDSGGGPAHGGILVEGGGLGLLRARANAGGSLKKLAYSAGLLHINVLQGIDGNDSSRSSGAQAFAKYALAASSSLSARLFLSDDFVQTNASPTTSGIPAANWPATGIIPALPGRTYFPGRDDPDSRRSGRFYSTAFIFRQILAPTLDLQASFQRLNTARNFQNGPAGPGFQPAVSNLSDFDGNIDTADARLNWRPASWWTLSGGYEFERETYRNADDNRVPNATRVAVETRAAQRSNALYFASQMAFAGRRLQLSLSGRTQDFRLDRPVFVYTGNANNYQNAAVATAPRAWTADAALAYFFPRSGTKLRAHAGNAYRAPGLYERYGSGFFFSSALGGVAYSPYGDPRLAPDRYNSADGGVDQYLLRDKLRISGTLFYTRTVSNTQFDSSASIVRPATDPFRRTSGYYNGPGGISRGLETSLELRPVRGTMLRSSYWFVNSDTDRDITVRGLRDALGIPRHSWTAVATQQLGRRTELTVDLFRSSSYYNAFFAGSGSRAFLFVGATKIDVVLSHDLLRTDAYSVRLYGKGDQILNRTYYENGFRAPGATGLVGLQVLFQ